MAEEMQINYTYTESGKQMMILDIGAPVSLAGISWMTEYLQEFGLTIEQLNSIKYSQPFVFGPSRRYLSESSVDILFFYYKDGWKQGCFDYQDILG